MEVEFPCDLQLNSMDCGPTCLRNISKYYGNSHSIEYIRQITGTDINGTNLLGMSEGAIKLGFNILPVKTSLKKILDITPYPLIAHLRGSHYVVVYHSDEEHIYISDPSIGLDIYPLGLFLAMWIGAEATICTEEGIALLLERSK